MVLIDLEKAYDRAPSEVLWECLEKKEVPETCIRAIKDLYEGVKASVRTLGGDAEDFSFNIELHQGSALNSFLFTIIMDVLSRRDSRRGNMMYVIS